ncbi:MAG: glutathione S-transferase N-terminal domain-containing protein [Pseudomonadota bacterium]|nr:glutathione S-transferase N-terminal domain-containing protein [Pseudomonadota bacterium]
MALVANRRSVMTLFSSASDPESHRVRVVLAEKGITVEILDVAEGRQSEDLLDLNPYNSVPTLVDRELVLYDPRAIMEYLDERFPHPPLMPVDPVSRARTRLALYRIEKDWYDLVPALESRTEKAVSKARKMLRDSLTAGAEVFAAKPYFLSDEFSLVDATIVPILWRLKHFEIDLPRQAKPVIQYAERMFERESFKASLSDSEREMME